MSRLLLLLAAVALALLLLGCEEDVVAVVGTAYPYELYGVLDPTADTQYVRVAPVEHALKPSGQALDAGVTTTDLEDGTTVVWRDSVLAYPDGTYGHVFWAAFTPVGGHRYHLDVTRSDDARSSAEVAVPRLPAVQGGAVRFGAPEVGPLDVRIEYFIEHGWCKGEWYTFRFDYRREAVASGDLQQVPLLLGRDRLAMRDSLLSKGRYNWTVGLVPRRVTLRIAVGDASWRPAGGVFDPEVLVEPGTLTNIENGFGFVGGGYRWETLLFETSGVAGGSTKGLPPAMMAEAGFTLVFPIPPQEHGICVPYP